MNIVLLDANQDCSSDIWSIEDQRQIKHLNQHLQLKAGDTLKVGVRDGQRYLTEVQSITAQQIMLRPIQAENVPNKVPVHLILALPRPKVLRRMIMDAVTLGVERISLIHSYRVDKSYWQSPFLQQLDDYVTLGLEQAGDTIVPEIQLYKRFKPFVEDVLPTLITEQRPAYVAHPYAEQSMPHAIAHGCNLIVGPEGGFIPYEIDLLKKNGCQAMSLGNRILRTETAVSNILGRLFV
ncbi:MAG: 16S rRNA (uracil(1498)-N(3))-methyltransferase [Acinetobacter sp. GWC1_38_13]|jgi:RsmE family RNA methyltransferase|uniref:16S rRNA (uracil(1498)-N(3))-methyltransferase n=1 Tax=Acinetobacter TaxID=469 RepID=UPI0008AE1C67|nr:MULTISPECIES: 16S rRNA (uracil(1498)-N(3))-methyltransferase [Acinetobacter]MCU4408005.1 16S rRNA (uracil(1498)-N(3))-methyltransferase [Acinetobacter junii]MDH0719497.1 16S rRNA (uracil(1498)-N(3))-methyltransferase [Acinetobacter junii]MEB8379665.1 16S rRNA (uracil(1498)-N(3))-methyltransferase [Acinetobacter junii]MQZ58546.1 16S rRNA (uracil(1498)-N(3))-methyltransferase [Acinetobacter junii]OFW43144.1 MAG: 16S rRNA (uracil(1498)-N(3))-methyltransferase [Acinetobacter sp. GWC1_38_13]